MGLLGDLAMGLGLQERDADYYERTAKTLGRTQGAEREAQYRASRAFTEQPKQAGLLSGFADRERTNRSFGYTDAEGNRVSALRDMFDGGGAGRSGQQFEGGLLALLANALGIRPMGYQEQAGPQTQPSSTPSPVKRVSPNWAGAQDGIALEGQAPRFGDASLSFGAGGKMPQYPTSSSLEFGAPREIPSPRRVNMPSFVDTRTNTQLYGDPLGSGQIVSSTSNQTDQSYPLQARLYEILVGGGYTPAEANDYLASRFGYYPRGR